MGQIVSGAAKPKRCNLNKLSQLGIPSAGEYILVSSDNSMKAAGQGNFDCYIVGNGRDAATTLELLTIADKDLIRGSKNAVSGGGVAKVIGNTDQTTNLTSANYAGFMFDGTKLIASTSTFNGYKIQIVKGQTYKFSGGVQSAKLFNSIVLNATPIANVSKDTLYTADADAWLYITIRTTAPNISFYLYASGILKELDILNTWKPTVDAALQDINNSGSTYSDAGWIDSSASGSEVLPLHKFIKKVVYKGTSEITEQLYIYTCGKRSSDDVFSITVTNSGGTTRSMYSGEITASSGILKITTTGTYMFDFYVDMGEVITGSSGYYVFNFPINISHFNGEITKDRPSTDYYARQPWFSKSANLNTISSDEIYKGLVYVHPLSTLPDGSYIKYFGRRNASATTLTFAIYDGNDTQVLSSQFTVDITGDLTTLMINRGGVKLIAIVDGQNTNIGAGFKDFGTNLKLDTNYFRYENPMPFTGKKIVCFGDSVTEFGTYPEQIGFLTGATVYKIGFGGCQMSKRNTSTPTGNAYNELSMYRVAQSIAANDFTDMGNAVQYLKNNESDDNTEAFNRLASIDFSTIDIVTIFYGTNDFTAGVLIGDETSTDVETIRGAMNAVVNSLQTAYPNLRVVFLTPTHRFFGTNSANDSDLVPVNGQFLKEICAAMCSQANYNHLPALNLYTESGLNKYNHTLYFGSDGVHPNTAGYTYLAERISAYLLSLYKNE